MEFQLSEDHLMLKDLVRRFVDAELMPLEALVMNREVDGRGPSLTGDERARIDSVSCNIGLWDLDAPEDIGGADLPAVAMVGVRGDGPNDHAFHLAARLSEFTNADGDGDRAPSRGLSGALCPR